MCGIVYVNRKDGRSAVKSVKKRYRKQRLRGVEGFGYVAIKDNKIVSYKRAPTEHEILELLDKETAPEILFHHRFPTSTPNMEEQAHPILVSNGIFDFDYYVVHNGVIRNPFLRKQEHDKMKIPYSTELTPLWKATSGKSYYADSNIKFNDSEALAVDTALALEGKLPGIDAEGAAAVIALKVKDGVVVDRIVYRNHGNPLKYDNNKHMVTIASQGNGNDVLPLYVAHLNPDYSLTIHPAKIFTPVSYRSAYHHTTSTPTVYDTYEAELEAGYSRGLDDDDAYSFDFPGLPAPEVKPEPVLGTKDLLSYISGEELWAEYDKLLGVRADLQNGVTIMDAKVMLRAETTEEAFNGLVKGRKSLQAKLDIVNVRYAALNAEIDRRFPRVGTRKTG